MSNKKTPPKLKVIYPQAKQKAKVFELSITLDLDVYKAKRSIVVSAKTTFLELHEILQTIFCWGGYHLYDFTIYNKKKLIASLVPAPDEDDEQYEYEEYDNEAEQKYLFEMYKTMQNVPDLTYEEFQKFSNDMADSSNDDLVDSEHTLDEYLPKYKSIIYAYDMGDNWEHEIKFKKEIENWDKELPYLISAEGAAPPDDVGGVPGFIDFLEAINNKKHPEHKHMKDWAGDWKSEIDTEFIRNLLK